VIDVVTVAYRSRADLRLCVEPLAGDPDFHVVVVDNACPERSSETLHGLDVEIVRMGRNAGFGSACNAGAARGVSSTVLFLNPDARIAPEDAKMLAGCIDRYPNCGAIGPHLFETNGELQLSMRRAPTLRSAFAEALWLHHLFPRAAWSSEIIRTGYDAPAEVDWLSGAVFCVRRSAFEAVGGFDEGFFMYSEDTDLCARLRAAGFSVRYEPTPRAVHRGGGSAPRPRLRAHGAAARMRYFRIHRPRAHAYAFRVSCFLHELLRLPLATFQSRSHATGRASAMVVAVTGRPPNASEGTVSHGSETSSEMGSGAA
jgi:GT2 family glycosyltransferase